MSLLGNTIGSINSAILGPVFTTLSGTLGSSQRSSEDSEDSPEGSSRHRASSQAPVSSQPQGSSQPQEAPPQPNPTPIAPVQEPRSQPTSSPSASNNNRLPNSSITSTARGAGSANNPSNPQIEPAANAQTIDAIDRSPAVSRPPNSVTDITTPSVSGILPPQNPSHNDKMQESPSKLNIAVACSVVLVFILALIAITFHWYRKRQKTRQTDEEGRRCKKSRPWSGTCNSSFTVWSVGDNDLDDRIQRINEFDNDL